MATLRIPEFAILDDVTRSFDSEASFLAQQAFEQFEPQHTVLVIALRLSTIVNADLSCVLADGRILERGRHHDLVSLDRMNARLWKDQFRHNDEKTVACLVKSMSSYYPGIPKKLPMHRRISRQESIEVLEPKT
jgi:subfamily B ATP-binding cassette protein MsbA